jgi:hypothetical protein
MGFKWCLSALLAVSIVWKDISLHVKAFVVYIFVGFLKGVWDHASVHACSEFLNMCV